MTVATRSTARKQGRSSGSEPAYRYKQGSNRWSTGTCSAQSLRPRESLTHLDESGGNQLDSKSQRIWIRTEPRVDLLNSGSQRNLWPPAERSDFTHVQQLTGRSIGRAGVELESSAKSGDRHDNFAELFDRDVFSAADIDNGFVVIAFEQQHDRIRQIEHVQKFAARSAGSPGDYPFVAAQLRFMKASDQCR